MDDEIYDGYVNLSIFTYQRRYNDLDGSIRPLGPKSDDDLWYRPPLPEKVAVAFSESNFSAVFEIGFAKLPCEFIETSPAFAVELNFVRSFHPGPFGLDGLSLLDI